MARQPLKQNLEALVSVSLPVYFVRVGTQLTFRQAPLLRGHPISTLLPRTSSIPFPDDWCNMKNLLQKAASQILGVGKAAPLGAPKRVIDGTPESADARAINAVVAKGPIQLPSDGIIYRASRLLRSFLPRSQNHESLKSHHQDRGESSHLAPRGATLTCEWSTSESSNVLDCFIGLFRSSRLCYRDTTRGFRPSNRRLSKHLCLGRRKQKHEADLKALPP